MVQPDPERDSAEKAESARKAEPAEKSEAELAEEAAERARRTVRAFEWSCGWLTLIAGAFLVSGMAQAGNFDGLAWVGAIVVIACVLALIALYVLCARDRVTLRTRLFGSVDLFQASTVVVVVAVIVGLVVPSNNHSALSLLLPWALTYWIYGMDRVKPPTDSSPTA
jgi:uncharacterized membrane protein YdbT with pleckstrin-like domain